MDVNTAAQLGTFFIALIGIILGLAQLRQASLDAHRSRMAEMSWQVYQSYAEARIRTARGAAEYIAHTPPLLISGEEYGNKYADKKINKDALDDETLDTNIRRLLRFYNQVGILLEKNLVDADFVFALIGPGLETSWAAVEPAIDWYQNYYEGISGHEKAKAPRPVHHYVQNLYQQYLAWEAGKKQ
jgi:hypothetical protein